MIRLLQVANIPHPLWSTLLLGAADVPVSTVNSISLPFLPYTAIRRDYIPGMLFACGRRGRMLLLVTGASMRAGRMGSPLG